MALYLISTVDLPITKHIPGNSLYKRVNVYEDGIGYNVDYSYSNYIIPLEHYIFSSAFTITPINNSVLCIQMLPHYALDVETVSSIDCNLSSPFARVKFDNISPVTHAEVLDWTKQTLGSTFLMSALGS